MSGSRRAGRRVDIGWVRAGALWCEWSPRDDVSVIDFIGRVGLLDPQGETPAEVRDALILHGLQEPEAMFVELLSRGAGAQVPYRFVSGPATGRCFGAVVTLADMAELRSAPNDDATVIAITGGGDLMVVGRTGEVFAELVTRDGTARRILHRIAGSIEELLELLEPDRSLLDDLIEFAKDDGLLDRPQDVAKLRARWGRG